MKEERFWSLVVWFFALILPLVAMEWYDYRWREIDTAPGSNGGFAAALGFATLLAVVVLGVLGSDLYKSGKP